MPDEFRRRLQEATQPRVPVRAEQNVQTALGSQVDARHAGRARDLSRRTGLPTETLLEAPSATLEDLDRRGARRKALERNAHVAQWLADNPNNALLSHDDVAGLTALSLSAGRMQAASRTPDMSATWGTTLWQLPMAGIKGFGTLGGAMYGLAAWGTDTAARASRALLGGDAQGLEDLSRRFQHLAEMGFQAPEIITEAAGGRDFMQRYDKNRWRLVSGEFAGLQLDIGFDDVAGAVASLIPTTAASAVSGGSMAAVVTAAALQSAGSTYASRRMQGDEYEAASGKAILAGVITGTLVGTLGVAERNIARLAGAGRAARAGVQQPLLTEASRIAGVKATLTQVLGGAGREFTEEFLDEFLQAVLIEGASVQQALEQGLTGGIIGGILGGVTSVSPGLYARRALRNQRAADWHQAQVEVGMAMDNSLTAQRSSEAAIDFLQQVNPDFRDSRAYIRPEDLDSLLSTRPQAEQALEAFGVSRSDIATALESGTSIEMKLADIHRLPRAVRDAVLEAARETPGAPNSIEVASADASAEGVVSSEELAIRKRIERQLTSEKNRLTKQLADSMKVDEKMARDLMAPTFEVARNLYARFPEAFADPADLLRRIVDIRHGTDTASAPVDIAPGSDLDVISQKVVDAINASKEGPVVPGPPMGEHYDQVHTLDTHKDQLQKFLKKNDYAADEVAKILRSFEAQMKVFRALGPVEVEFFPHGEGVAPRKRGPIRKNSDPIYRITFDASAMCVRRLQAGATLTAISQRLGRALNVEEIMALVQMFRGDGKMAPCLYCYVEAPRAHAVQAIGQAVEFLDGERKPGKKWSQKTLDAARRAKAEYEAAGAPEIDATIVFDPEVRMTDWAKAKLEALPETYQFLRDQYLAKKANLPKVYESYDGQFLHLPGALLEELAGYAGVRFFSSSDFQAEHVADLMQAVFDLSVRGAKAHAYTKVEDFVRIFGNTRMKIQTSLFAKTLPDGTFVEDTSQGMSWESARQFREQFKNVGTVFVASSDQQVAWAMAQPWIDYLIPFHHSSVPKKYQIQQGWQDFTSTQTETPIYKTGKVPKIRQHETGSARGISDRQGTRNYLELAMKRQVYPVFPAFVFKDGLEPVYGKSGKKLLADQRKAQTARAKARWKAMVESGKIDWSQINESYYKLKKDYARTDTAFQPVQPRFDKPAVQESVQAVVDQATPQPTVDVDITARMDGLIKWADKVEADTGTRPDVGLLAMEMVSKDQPVDVPGAPRTEELAQRSRDMDQLADTEQTLDRDLLADETLEQSTLGKTTIEGGERYIVQLFSGNNPSTILHESAHIFFNEMHRIRRLGYADEQLLSDLRTIDEFAGAEYALADTDGRRQVHEAFARGFEEFLMEGKPPVSRWKALFGRFRRWLTGVYQEAANMGSDRVPLTDPVREVFNRMLTAQGEADMAWANMGPITEREAEAIDGMHSSRLGRLNKLLEDGKNATTDALLITRAAKRQAQESEWRREAVKSVMAEPVYEAWGYIREEQGLSKEMVTDRFGDQVAADLEAKGLLGGQVNPDTAALAAQFPSGDALIAALHEARTPELAVESRVKAQAEQAAGDFAAVEAMMETQQLERFLTRLLHSVKGEYSPRTFARTAADVYQEIRARMRQEAEHQMANVPAQDATRPDRFQGEVSRLLNEGRRALREGNQSLAHRKFHQSRLALEKVRIATRAKKRMELIERQFNRLTKVKRGVYEDQHYLTLLGVARRYGFLAIDPPGVPQFPYRQTPRTLMASRVDPETGLDTGADVTSIFGAWLLDDRPPLRYDDQPVPSHYKQMTMNEVEEVFELARLLGARGRKLADQRLFQGKIKLDEARNQIVSRMAERVPTRAPLEEGTFRRWLRDNTDTAAAALDQWLFVVRRMDGFSNYTRKGGEAGPAERLLWDPLHDADNAFIRLTEQVNEVVIPAMEQLMLRPEKTKYYTQTPDGTPLPPVSEAMRRAGEFGWTWQRIAMIALNRGNNYNAEATARGLGWVKEQADGRIVGDASRLTPFYEMLSDADWDAVQAIWDGIGLMKQPLGEVFERQEGFPLTFVEADPFILPGGKKIRGGYFPVAFDPSKSEIVGQRTEQQDVALAAGAMFPTVSAKDGMTNARRGTGGLPVLLDTSVLLKHINQTARYITMSEPVTDIWRIVNDEGFKAAFSDRFGQAHFRQARKMLADVLRPDAEVLTSLDRGLNKVASYLHPWYLGYNPRTLISMLGSYGPLATDFGAGALWSSAHTMLSQNPLAAIEQADQISDYLRGRKAQPTRELATRMRDIAKELASGRKPGLRRKLEDFGYAGMLAVDRVVTYGTWWAVYNKAIAQHTPPKEAVRRADQAVQMTQNVSRRIDLSPFAASKSGVARLMTFCSSWTLRFGNRQRHTYLAWKQGAMSNQEFMTRVILEGVITPLMLITLYGAAQGLYPGKDEKEEGDWWKRYARDAAQYHASGTPFLRELVSRAANRRSQFSDSMPALSAMDTLYDGAIAFYRMAEGLSHEEGSPVYEQSLWALAEAMSLVSRVPASKVYQRLSEGWRQVREEDEAVWSNIVFPNPNLRQRR